MSRLLYWLNFIIFSLTSFCSATEEPSMSDVPHFPFIFVRHGHTDWRIDHIANGVSDLNLNSTGIIAVNKLAESFMPYNDSIFVCSPKQRAIQTASIITGSINQKNKTHFHNGIDARYYGDFSLNRELAARVIDSVYSGLLSEDQIQWPADAESILDFENRVKFALIDILSKFHQDNKLVIIVSHSEVFQALLKQLLITADQKIGKSEAFFFFPPSDSNKSWTISSFP